MVFFGEGVPSSVQGQLGYGERTEMIRRHRHRTETENDNVAGSYSPVISFNRCEKSRFRYLTKFVDDDTRISKTCVVMIVKQLINNVVPRLTYAMSNVSFSRAGIWTLKKATLVSSRHLSLRTTSGERTKKPNVTYRISWKPVDTTKTISCFHFTKRWRTYRFNFVKNSRNPFR